MHVLSPVTLVIAMIIAATVLSCLCIIGIEYFNAVLWHNLKVEVHKLRLDQQSRLEQIYDDANAATGPAGPASPPIPSDSGATE